MYVSVVLQYSVLITLTLAALNDLEVKTSDIQNAYLTAPCWGGIWTMLGSELGTYLSGKKSLVFRSLYGPKSAGASFRNHLAECMRDIGYSSCLVDPDVWFKEETRPSDGAKYYAYLVQVWVHVLPLKVRESVHFAHPFLKYVFAQVRVNS